METNLHKELPKELLKGARNSNYVDGFVNVSQVPSEDPHLLAVGSRRGIYRSSRAWLIRSMLHLDASQSSDLTYNPCKRKVQARSTSKMQTGNGNDLYDHGVDREDQPQVLHLRVQILTSSLADSRKPTLRPCIWDRWTLGIPLSDARPMSDWMPTRE